MQKKFSSNELPLAQLLDQAASGVLQLPDFQRGWVWDDDHIRSLLASISLSYPIGAVMTLVAGNPGVNFKARLLEGVKLEPRPEPDMLLLDGQQRLTSLFQALKSRDPVHTRTSRGKELLRHYYANIEACIDPSVDREEEGIVGIPADRIVRSDFGRVVDLDLRTRGQEIAAEMFPLDIVLDGGDTMDWQMAYLGSRPGDVNERLDKWKRFQVAVINPFVQYHVPTIDLAKSTPKEAVCQVFEKVNTGGVTLTVFELLTATYATDDFELRKNWDARQQRLRQDELLKKVDATAFLQIVTLMATYERTAVAPAGTSGGRQGARSLLQAPRGLAPTARQLQAVGGSGRAGTNARGSVSAQPKHVPLPGSAVHDTAGAVGGHLRMAGRPGGVVRVATAARAVVLVRRPWRDVRRRHGNAVCP